MSRWIVLGVWVTVAFLAALFYGQLNFSARPLPQEYKVGVVLKAMDSEYWLAVRSRMENTAREKGMRLIVMAPENEAAYAEQEQIVRDLLAADVDALVIAPVDIDRADVYAGMAAERAVPLLTIDEKITDVPYIGSDNYAIGQMAAAYMVEHIPEGGTVGILAGVAQQDAHRQRVAGFRDYVQEHGGLRLAVVTMDAAQYREAALQTEHMIEEHPNLAGLFVTSAIMSLGAVDTLSAHTAHPVLVGVDTQNDALRALRDGRIDAIISQDGNDTGRMAIEAVSDALAGRTIPANSYITNALITAVNAEDYLLQEDF